MTKHEAIARLKKMFVNCDTNRCSHVCKYCDEAINIAIEALEQEQSEIIRCKNCRHDNNCEIQYSAQAGSKFFCGFAERKEQ